MLLLELSLVNLLFDTAILFSIFSSILVIVLRHKFQKVDRIFGYSILLAGLFEIIAKVTVLINFENNLPGLHLYTLLEFILISIFFKVLLESLGFNWNFKLIIFIGSFLIILNSIFFESIYGYNSVSKSFVELYFIVFSLISLVIIIRDNTAIFEFRSTVYFICSIFLGSAVSILYYLFSKRIMQMNENQQIYLTLLNVGSNILSQFMILKGLHSIYKEDEKIIT